MSVSKLWQPNKTTATQEESILELTTSMRVNTVFAWRPEQILMAKLSGEENGVRSPVVDTNQVRQMLSANGGWNFGASGATSGLPRYKIGPPAFLDFYNSNLANNAFILFNPGTSPGAFNIHKGQPFFMGFRFAFQTIPVPVDFPTFLMTIGFGSGGPGAWLYYDKASSNFKFRFYNNTPSVVFELLYPWTSDTAIHDIIVTGDGTDVDILFDGTIVATGTPPFVSNSNAVITIHLFREWSGDGRTRVTSFIYAAVLGRRYMDDVSDWRTWMAGGP